MTHSLNYLDKDNLLTLSKYLFKWVNSRGYQRLNWNSRSRFRISCSAICQDWKCSNANRSWENNAHQTFSFPRDWRLSAIMCAQLSTAPILPWINAALSYWGVSEKPSLSREALVFRLQFLPVWKQRRKISPTGRNIEAKGVVAAAAIKIQTNQVIQLASKLCEVNVRSL